jgi:hypothetical protein
MGKGYPMWVKDTFEYGTISQSYRAKCTRHEGETAFHAEAKRQFAASCRNNVAIGTTYKHNNVRDSAEKSESELTGGLLLTGNF